MTCRKTLVLLMLVLQCLAGCKKGADPAPEPTPEVPKEDYGNFYKLIRVENFQGDTTDSDPTAPKANLYYSLESNTPRLKEYEKTSKWDLSFGNLYASFIGGNNGKDHNNIGYGTTAQGGVMILDQAFDQVTNVPGDTEFRTGTDLLGTDDAGDFGQGMGWYLYDFSGTRAGDGSYQQQHIAYALGNGLTLNNGTQVSPRTILVRTANGNYAKLRMISVYKDAFTPDKWSRNAPHMYFSFEYVMVPKGSKIFETRP